MTPETRPDTGVRNPYVGPRPFEESDRKLFFGRDRETNELASLVVAHRVLVLYAPSGAGKTSLLNAGLIPLLKEEEGFEVLPLTRVRGLIPDGMRLEQIPNLYIFNTLLSWEEESTGPETLTRERLADGLKLRRRAEEREDPQPRLLVFDQFEELFSSYPERWRDRRGFFLELAEAMAADPLLRVVLVLREDYLAQLDPYATFLPERLRTRFRLDRLRETAAREAIEEPLRDSRRSFQPGVARELVEKLSKIPIETTAGVNVIGEFIDPVQLQVVCQSLWRNLPNDVSEISRDHLRAFGDVDQVLSIFYETAVAAASGKVVVSGTGVSEAELRRWFEHTLITPAATRGTVYRGQEETGGIANTVVDELETLHLVRGEYRGGSRWYELSHDRFIEPVRQSNARWRTKRLKEHDAWQRLETKAESWIAQGAGSEDLLDGPELLEAERWLKNPSFAALGVSEKLLALVKSSRSRSESKAALRLRRWVGILLVTLLIVVGLASVAVWQGQLAKRQNQHAIAGRLSTNALAHLEDQLDLALLLSIEAYLSDSSAETHTTLYRVVKTASRLSVFLHYEQGAEVRSVAFSSNSRVLASGCRDGIIRLWDVETRHFQEPLVAHAFGVLSVAFSPDNKILASSSWDGTVRLWDLNTLQLREEPFSGNDDWVWSVAFSPDGRLLALGTGTGIVWLWDVRTHQFLGELSGHSGKVVNVAFSPDSHILASCSNDRMVRLWDVGTRQPLDEPLSGHTGMVSSVAFAPDGQILASASADGTVRLWDVATRQPLGEPLSGPTGMVSGPVDHIQASASDNDTVRLWDVATRQFPGEPPAGMSSVAFAPAGRLIMASASDDGTVQLWDVATRKPLRELLSGHAGSVESVAFSPDGSILASGSADRTVRLWDLAKLQFIGGPPISEVRSDVLEGQNPFSGYIDIHWSLDPDPDPEALKIQACRIANRNLSAEEWRQYMGSDVSYRHTCPELPPGE